MRQTEQNVKRYLYSVALTIIILSYLHFFYAKQLQIIVWIIIALLTLAALFLLTFGGWFLAEKMKMLRAARIELEKEAHVLQLHNTNQVWIRDTDSTAQWHALHLDQRVYSNHRYTEPTELERKAWLEFNAKPAKVIEGQPQLIDSQIPFADAINNADRCLIVGASNSGKTTVLQHIVNVKKNSSNVVVIDPHSYPGKWSNCKVIGLGRNYQAIEVVLNNLLDLMNQRYEAIAQGKLQHTNITIIIDEWRSITNALPSAGATIKTLLTESRKANFSIYVASHSDRARPLGLQGEYDLKEGFTVVRLFFDRFRRFATIDFGNGQKPLELLQPLSIMTKNKINNTDNAIDNTENETNNARNVSRNIDNAINNVLDGIDNQINNTDNILGSIENDQNSFDALSIMQPNDTEKLILHLHAQGIRPTPIAEKVFGSKGGNQVAQVNEVIAKFTK